MVTLAPLPLLRDIFCALASSIFDKGKADRISEFYGARPGDACGFLSRSAWSLALIAAWRIKFNAMSQVTVWLPDYFCNQSTLILRTLNVRLVFYEILSDFTPNYESIRGRTSEYPPDIFVLTHYFGRISPTAQARELCKRFNTWLVEDSAHVLECDSRYKPSGDFQMFSPHKLFPIPNGALVLARPDGPSRLGEAFIKSLGDPMGWAKFIRKECPTIRPRELLIVWVIKRTLQRIGVKRRATAMHSRPEADISNHFPPPCFGRFARHLLSRQIPRIRGIKRNRIRNKIILDHIMNQFGASVFTRPMLVDESCEVPYVARYETAASILLLNNLRTLGLPAYQWPDLPPEVLNNAESHIQAKKLFQVNIFLPIHQTITEKDLARLYQPKRSYTYGLIIKSWSDSEEDWDEMVARAEFSNILQCSAYGSAKENSGGWKVERYVINRGDVPIAFLQILKKSFLGLLTLYRLSRGPLFFENISIDERAQACYLIRRKFGSLKRRKVLSWAPELLFNGENLILLWQMRVRRFSAHNWISDVIDLSLGEDELRAKLSTKWRNLLNDSKRKGVTTRLSHSPSEYTRLLECCERTLGDRGVHFPIKLYRELHHLILDKQHKYLHLIAESSGKSLASIYVVIHGKTATYLLGWNSEDGRHLRAHNLLLWDALLRLKDQSLSYFDLGGVDFENTPGIASFKSGLRGDRYQLVGECFCF